MTRHAPVKLRLLSRLLQDETSRLLV